MMELFAATGFSSVTPVASSSNPMVHSDAAVSQPGGNRAPWISPWPRRRGGLQSRDRERPDADRLGAAVRDDDGWHVLRGDQIGWLLASAMLPTMSDPVTSSRRRCVIHAVARDGARRGRYFTMTLTGFNGSARRRRRVLRLGYEEAPVRGRSRGRDKMASRPPSRSLVSRMTSRSRQTLNRSFDEIELVTDSIRSSTFASR